MRCYRVWGPEKRSTVINHLLLRNHSFWGVKAIGGTCGITASEAVAQALDLNRGLSEGLNRNHKFVSLAYKVFAEPPWKLNHIHPHQFSSSFHPVDILSYFLYAVV